MSTADLTTCVPAIRASLAIHTASVRLKRQKLAPEILVAKTRFVEQALRQSSAVASQDLSEILTLSATISTNVVLKYVLKMRSASTQSDPLTAVARKDLSEIPSRCARRFRKLTAIILEIVTVQLKQTSVHRASNAKKVVASIYAIKRNVDHLQRVILKMENASAFKAIKEIQMM